LRFGPWMMRMRMLMSPRLYEIGAAIDHRLDELVHVCHIVTDQGDPGAVLKPNLDAANGTQD